MNHRRFAALSALFACTLCGVASAAEIKGAEILNHACGKVALKSAGLLRQGKMDEANMLSTKTMQDRWKAMPAKDREMIVGMAKITTPTEAEFTAAIKTGGVLVVDDKSGKLTVTQKKQDANGSSTSTTTQEYAINGSECLITR
ncbi:MAG: hypothetical protein ABIT82_01080 [Ramlibacter sp.]